MVVKIQANPERFVKLKLISELKKKPNYRSEPPKISQLVFT